MSLEFLLYLVFLSWSLYLGINFFKMVEKHKEIYDDNVSLDEDRSAVLLEKF